MLNLHKSLKIIGRSVTFVGIIIQLANLLGCFQSKHRLDFYQLVINSPSVISVTHPAVKDFIKRFPPPVDFDAAKITHITRLKLQTASGFPVSGTLQYMNKEGKKSSDIASFEDVRIWVGYTNYGLYAWIITAIGFIIMILTDIFEWKSKRKIVKKLST